MPVRIVYESHATTTDNEAGIATGWLPGRLSPTGRRQAAELGGRRRGTGLDAVYTSDLARAVETARIAFTGAEAPVLRQDPRLRECDYGELNGSPTAVLHPLRTRHIDRPWPGGQSYRDVVDATAAFLRDLAAEWDGGQVLLIAHSANRWSLDCLLAGTRLESLVAHPPPWQPGVSYTLP
ncbi:MULTISPECIES: histidine phosphatase family protein [unclassified Streptomyces]|uniref:histidine phosphatase family protein n=1 Tax=unclassified Streptomyces TaxID=2593676 RepID=UPI000372E886|nr:MULTISPECIES: histidine phosphatase family protein [unclassified Streptomyces]MYY02468.1 histidine phosphatase family protein [Streptomyces sp. SID4913]